MVKIKAMKNSEKIRSKSVIEHQEETKFRVLLSSKNQTSKKILNWRVIISQVDWLDSITDKTPRKQIRTDSLTGLFHINVEILCGVSGLWQSIKPLEGSFNRIRCNSNSTTTIGIVTDSNSSSIQTCNVKFWTKNSSNKL